MKKNILLKVLFLSAEVSPLAKVGGLGDVAGSLPKALSYLGVDLRIIMPFYGCIDKKKYKTEKIGEFEFFIGGRKEKIKIYQTALPGSQVPVWLIKHPIYDPKVIYTGLSQTKSKSLKQSTDDIRRFSFYTKAALETCIRLKFKPDIIHANDWHTALVPDLVKTYDKNIKFFRNTKTLYTIHNLANQGIAKSDIIKYSKIDHSLPVVNKDLKNGDINFMVQGILAADAVNTVSPTYAREIFNHFQSMGLEKVISQRKGDLTGILNGIDTEFFNPEVDRKIFKRFGKRTLEYKKDNKTGLQKNLNLRVGKKIALIGIISRFVWQKGFDLIADELIDPGKNRLYPCQFVFLGEGDEKIEKKLKNLEKKYPKHVKAIIKFDENLAHKIYASSDIFLMPSLFEPCGLGQLIAMRYGTIPLVHFTGGLADTVGPDVGFGFRKYSESALSATLGKALKIYYDAPKKWKMLQLNCIQADYSWDRSARSYLALYRSLLGHK
jgi:starch synthase